MRLYTMLLILAQFTTHLYSECFLPKECKPVQTVYSPLTARVKCLPGLNPNFPAEIKDKPKEKRHPLTNEVIGHDYSHMEKQICFPYRKAIGDPVSDGKGNQVLNPLGCGSAKIYRIKTYRIDQQVVPRKQGDITASVTIAFVTYTYVINRDETCYLYVPVLEGKPKNKIDGCGPQNVAVSQRCPER